MYRNLLISLHANEWLIFLHYFSLMKMQILLNTRNCLNGSVSGCPYKSQMKMCKHHGKCFHTQNPSSADPTQFQRRHTGTHGKPAWQDLRSNSSWCAKASHEAAETSSSKGIIILNCHNHHLFRPLVGCSSKRLESQQTREKKNDLSQSKMTTQEL